MNNVAKEMMALLELKKKQVSADQQKVAEDGEYKSGVTPDMFDESNLEGISQLEGFEDDLTIKNKAVLPNNYAMNILSFNENSAIRVHGPPKHGEDSDADTTYRKLRELEGQLLELSDDYGTELQSSMQYKSQLSHVSIISKPD